MVTGRQLRFGLRHVERSAVGLGMARDEVGQEGDARRNVSLEDEPSVGLLGHDFGELHGAGKDHDDHQRQPGRYFVTDKLCPAAHGAYHRILAVARPSGQQDAYHAERRDSEQVEYAHVEVDGLQPFGERQRPERAYRTDNHEERCHPEKHLVRLVDVHQLLEQYLYHVRHGLEDAPLAHAVGAEAALEESAYLPFGINQEERYQSVGDEYRHSYQHELHQQRPTVAHAAVQRSVNPLRQFFKTPHNPFLIH